MDKLPMEFLQTIASFAIIILTTIFGKNANKKHSKDMLKETLKITANYATSIVIKLAQRGDLTNEAKYKTALAYVTKRLKEQGLKVSVETVGAKVEEAYQTYKNDGGDIHKFTDDLVNKQVDDIDKVVNPEDRMVKGLQNKEDNK